MRLTAAVICVELPNVEAVGLADIWLGSPRRFISTSCRLTADGSDVCSYWRSTVMTGRSVAGLEGGL